MEIVKNGVLLQDREIYRKKCGICNSKLRLQIYRYDKKLTKVVHCRNCKTYSHLKQSKSYNTDIKEIVKPKFLNKKE